MFFKKNRKASANQATNAEKLVLKRETLRTLSNDDLGMVAGGRGCVTAPSCSC